ncbi:MAG: hypothetical protein J6P07_00265 [Spirochaetaceae bacterium]|nr:hypothetical protein [Spirochaetaceae bacterium]MBO7731949.1 hypothetical protein [Methanobrevibacter sp.]
MTLQFKVITSSNAADFEHEINNFMEKNYIMDIKYSTSSSSFSAFIMYCSKEESEKEAQEKIDSLQKDLNRQINIIKQTTSVKDEVLQRSFLAANDMLEKGKQLFS